MSEEENKQFLFSQLVIDRRERQFLSMAPRTTPERRQRQAKVQDATKNTWR
jgi:hypothetical protein